MEPPKPVVWIATTLSHFDHKGLSNDQAFAHLADHYRKPIEELIRSAGGLPWDIQVVVRAGGSVARERCRFATEFTVRDKSPDDILLMVDYDLMPTGQDYVSLLSRMSSGIDICGGIYTTRENGGRWVLNPLSGARPTPSGLLPVMELGTGFKAFKLSVFQRVLLKNPWLDCESEFDQRMRLLGFFSTGGVEDVKLWPGRRRWLTEDYWFDWLCRMSDIPTIADTRIKIRHWDEGDKVPYPAIFPDPPGQLPDEAQEL